MFSIQRIAVLGGLFLAALVLISLNHDLRNAVTWGGATDQGVAGNNAPSSLSSSGPEAFYNLFAPTRHKITALKYVDPSGQEFHTHSDGPWWHQPLKKDVLIVDIDTRIPNGPNQLMNNARMNWESVSKDSPGGMISATYMNHFLYAQIHGYDYQILSAQDMHDMYNTWTRPHLLLELVKSHRFIVAMDADATIQHLEVPLEWLFNRWGIKPNTSIAMPIDTAERHGDNEDVSKDSKGKVVLNAGFIVAQSSPHTIDLLTAWAECPTEKKYPGCSQWKNKWSHEQRAFSEYIRYDFNQDGDNIIEIPCDDAMGYPGITKHERIMSNCTGQFVRHHTLDKPMTKTSTEVAVMQGITDLLQKELLNNKDRYWFKEPKTWFGIWH